MKRTLQFHYGVPALHLYLGKILFDGLTLWLLCLPITSHVHAASPITPSGLNTQVNAPLPIANDKTQFDIMGGTRAGTNLFHSFGQFDVPANNIANFLNDTGLPTTNILSRVTGGNASSILGTIQTTGFGDANLSLMNPAGIVFGPNASLNVAGSVTFTTANYLRLSESNGQAGIFYANPASASLLTNAPIAAFGFLNSSPSAIDIQGSSLTTQPGQSISLIGGDLTIESGLLMTNRAQPIQPNVAAGQINLTSVASPGEILTTTLASTPNVNGQSLGALGTIRVLGQSVIDASGTGGGSVVIRGGQFVLDSSRISANINAPGPIVNGGESIGNGINIAISQAAKIQNGATIETNVTGNATHGVLYGGININADHIEVSSDLRPPNGNAMPTFIQSNVEPGSTGGNSGGVSLRANHDIHTELAFIQSRSQHATGNAGSIELISQSGSISLTSNTFISSQTIDSPGIAGNIILTASNGNILFTDSLVTTYIQPPISSNGTRTIPAVGSGEIQITTNNLQMNGGEVGITNLSNLSPGDLTVTLLGNLILRSGSQFPASSIHASSNGSAPSAGLTVKAQDILITENSSLATETVSSGNGGPLTISVENLQLTDGGHVESGSIQGINPGTGLPVPFPPSGSGGMVTIHGLETPNPARSVLIDGPGSGIFSNAEGIGAAGDVVVKATSLTLKNAGEISAKTTGISTEATGGSITINATDHVTLTDGGSITASSTGPADAGNVSINAGQQLNIENSKITTEANQSKAGDINIQAVDQVRVSNGEISTSVHSGAGRGGNITIDPKTVILQNGSKVFAQAVQGSGGNITITTPLYLKDATSRVNADSQFGLNGSVTIQSPTSNLSGTVGQLASKTSPPQVLLQNRCVALAGGEQSTFILAGRDALPSEPGGWLSSPVAMEHWTGEVPENHVSRLMVRSRGWNTQPSLVMSKDETTVLSLRQLTPSGFLVRPFAESAPTGCGS
ncbi:MAG: filamentous hemagglutinin N-terminal domain-containing protein [Nitrospira sp.]|nr:filamentous hemagglutinin N-terminal domain-containing protein [Nitrospira sp.]